jgi:uncharacterized phage protein (TIGR01671 family)
MDKREIKFRAWDKNEGKMLRPSVEFKQLLRQISDRNDNSIGGDAIRRHDLDWMQFTGLHDRDGKEIYEGDVVQVENNIYSQKTFAVVWSGDRWSFEDDVDFDNGDQYRGDEIEWDRTEVIGNIYEHPELLEK